MSTLCEKNSIIIDPFIIRFLQTTIAPPPPLPACVFIYDPAIVVPPLPSTSSSPPKNTNQSNRHRYSPIASFTLHRIFNQLPYPSLEQRRLIAEHLNIDADQVRIWFSNRRSRKRFNSQPITAVQPTSKEQEQCKELFIRLNLSCRSL